MKHLKCGCGCGCTDCIVSDNFINGTELLFSHITYIYMLFSMML